MLRWLRSQTKKQVPIYIFQPTGMTLERWQSSSLYTAEARRLFADRTFQDIFSLLTNHRPQGYPVRGQDVSDTQALIELGRIEGYNDCLRLIVSLAQLPPKMREPLEATFEPPEKEDDDGN